MFTCLLKRGRPRPVIGLASVLLLVALLLTPPAVPARADTAVWTVTNTNGSGTGSFQDAMNQAIQHQGPNVINFNIPASDPGYDPDHGVWTIHLDAGYDLPAFGNTTIDGATQPQGPAQQTSPRIYFAVQVSGYPLFPISSSDNVLRGLGIMGFHQPAAAIRISGLGAWSNVIDNCVIGLAADGETARPFQNGVEILAPAGQNTVQNSTIADNTGHGVYIAGNGASSNTISANWISGNGGDGIHIQDGAVSNSIVDNTIESNTQNGIHVIGSNQTYIASNYIGYWAPEHVPPLDFANGGSGVLLEGGSKYTTVSGNRIAGNLFDGVSIGGANTDWNTVAANDIGYVETPQGTVLRNNHHGIDIYDGAAGNTIGDAVDDSLGNTIIGCGWSAVAIANSSGNVVARNFTYRQWSDQQGLLQMTGNAFHGVDIYNGSNNIIGPANRIMFNGSLNNLDNQGHGVHISGASAQGNRITRNYIAYNSGKGISLENGANGGVAPPLILGGACTVVVVYPCPTCPPQCPYCSGLVEVFSDNDGQGELYEAAAPFVPQQTVIGLGGRFRGPQLTATYTDQSGNTSEFSAAWQIGVCRYVFLPAMHRGP